MAISLEDKANFLGNIFKSAEILAGTKEKELSRNDLNISKTIKIKNILEAAQDPNTNSAFKKMTTNSIRTSTKQITAIANLIYYVAKRLSSITSPNKNQLLSEITKLNNALINYPYFEQLPNEAKLAVRGSLKELSHPIFGPFLWIKEFLRALFIGVKIIFLGTFLTIDEKNLVFETLFNAEKSLHEMRHKNSATPIAYEKFIHETCASLDTLTSSHPNLTNFVKRIKTDFLNKSKHFRISYLKELSSLFGADNSGTISTPKEIANLREKTKQQAEKLNVILNSFPIQLRTPFGIYYPNTLSTTEEAIDLLEGMKTCITKFNKINSLQIDFPIKTLVTDHKLLKNFLKKACDYLLEQTLQHITPKKNNAYPTASEIREWLKTDQAQELTFLFYNRYDNALSYLPAELFQLKSLESLSFSESGLICLPPEIGNLQNLTELNLSKNKFTRLPKEIGNLKKLTHLNLENNQLSQLPPEIGSLQNLTNLNLENNQLSKLPPEIGSLQKLSYLNLENNQLSQLPPEIGSLQNLTSLNLNNNQLSQLPPKIGSLQNLESLNLNYNQLTELPPEIGSLKNLASINIDHNQLTQLPPEIGSLRNLDSLNLNNNQLSQLPPEIGSLQKLWCIHLSHNRLKWLPKKIGSLQKLKFMILTHNRLYDLPPEIGSLKNLENLNLNNNHLTQLPPEIGSLKKLKNLFLRRNSLTGLPPEMRFLQELIDLDLSNNRFTNTPPEILHLQKIMKAGFTMDKKGVLEEPEEEGSIEIEPWYLKI